MNLKDRKYLRRKTLLVHEYIIGGVVLATFGLLFYRYNKRINPRDKKDEENKSILHIKFIIQK